MKAKLLLLFLVVCAISAHGQEIDSLNKQVRLEGFLENMAEYYYLEDEHNYLRNNPINIISADKDELMKLPLISEELAEKILAYRDTSKNIGKNNLKRIINDKIIFGIIEPFISFEPVIKDYDFSYQSSSALEMQNRRGFDTLYEGNKHKFLSKAFIKYIPYNLSSALTIEKDPGESKYTDHFSGYLKHETENIKIIIGDFRAAFGNGLTLGSSSLSFMGDDIATIFTGNKSGFTAYNGTEENNFLRGVCVETYLYKMKASLFYSSKNKDANIDEGNYVTSLYSSGYHRYANEIKKENNLNEKIFGGRFLYSLNSHEFSLSFYNADYDNNFFGSGYYGLRGNSFNAIGLNYFYSSELLNASTEITRTKNNIYAGLVNIKLFFMEGYQLYLNVRKYPYDFNNPFANAASSTSSNQNEEGIMAGIKISPLENLEINSYADVYKIPYRTYYNPLPSKGMEVMLKAQYTFDNHIFTFRYRRKTGDECITIEDPLQGDKKVVTLKSKNEYRMEYNSLFFEKLYLKTRVEINSLKYELYRSNETGFIFFQDCLWKALKSLSLNSRIIFFNTDSYETALYEYERDVSGIYSVNALSDKGYRFYFVLNYKLEDYLSLMFKFSNTTYSNKESIGSSYDELKGKSLSKISFELNFKL